MSSGRLLWYDVDLWVHANCALMSDEVHKDIEGALVNFNVAIKKAIY